ncbi:MAG: hypothetical protein ACXIUZ_01595 [Lysobacteraceae bacterium]
MHSTLRQQVAASFPSDHANAKSFVATCRALARNIEIRDAVSEIEAKGLPAARKFAEKAAQPAQTLGDAWGSEGGRELAESYLGSVADEDVLTLLARYARTVPNWMRSALIAHGTNAGTTAEGLPKAVRELNLLPGELERVKTTGLLVMSQELFDRTDGAARGLFERELRNAVTSATNIAAAAQFNTTPVAGGSNAREDLAAALAASAPSRGFVVLADWSMVRELAVDAEGRMGVHGGDYIPGVHIVGFTADSATPRLIAMPADRVNLIDYGVTVRNARHASVEMSDTPTGAGELVSLWQTNCVGLVVERSFALVSNADAITVA